ncbi:PASTA domain-containing protein [Micromonospora echinofusca]|uniref:PASTA domain-containing protein n=1 Tax=Micromonospora echinofusca TaxID=47858 RepID=A0ABS3VJ54_MICEH|nr:PASTA domain-containing protein [Micromonospora echinofusca]MBO4204556.1 PASTA domain-containing protein [Micromonospora echinofusca]
MDQSDTDRSGVPVRRSGRGKLVVGSATAFVVLATLGALGGHLLATGETGRPAADAGNAPAANAPPATGPTPRTPRPTTGRPSTPAAQQTTGNAGAQLPDLVGKDFEQARTELRKRRLGWRLVFGSDGASRAVQRTEPASGAPVRPGDTVQLFVAGAAPVVRVPNLSGDGCAEAAQKLVDAGLYPRYASGRQGTVHGQDPAADAEARWNDQVEIVCGSASPAVPTAGPSPTY